MKKLLNIFMIFISVLMFFGLILIAIYADRLPDFMKIIGFTVIGYASLILFTISVFQIGKSKKESNDLN